MTTNCLKETTNKMKSLADITHPELVAALVKPGEQIVNETNDYDRLLWLLSSRLMVAAATLFDTIKRLAIYRKNLDADKIHAALNQVDENTGLIRIYLYGLKSGEMVEKVSMSAEQAHLWHMISALAGESGELLEGFLKHLCDGEPFDIDNTVEELGDIEFYLEGIRAPLNVPVGLVKELNIKKLSKRYVGLTYSDKSAQERADKTEVLHQIESVEDDLTHSQGCATLRGEPICTCPVIDQN